MWVSSGYFTARNPRHTPRADHFEPLAGVAGDVSGGPRRDINCPRPGPPVRRESWLAKVLRPADRVGGISQKVATLATLAALPPSSGLELQRLRPRQRDDEDL